MDLLKSLFIGILAGALTISTAAAQDSQANVDRSSAKNLFRVFDSKGPVELNKGSEEQKKSCPQFIERNKANEMFGRQFQCECNNVVPPKNVPEPPQPMMCPQMQDQPGPMMTCRMMPHVFMRHMNPMMCPPMMGNHNGPMMMPDGPMMPPPPFMPMFGHMKNPMMRPPVMFMPQMFFGGMEKFDPAKKDEFLKRIIAHIRLEMKLNPEFKKHILDEFDADQNGKLSDKEIKNGIEERRHKIHVQRPFGPMGFEPQAGREMPGVNPMMMGPCPMMPQERGPEPMKPMICPQMTGNHPAPMMNGPMMPPPPPPFMPMFGPMNHPMYPPMMKHYGHVMRHPMMFMPQMFFGGMKNFAPANKDEFMKRAIAYTKLEMELTPKFKEHMLNKFDINKDGMLSDDEIKSAVESHHKNMRMSGPKFDHNKPEPTKIECEKCREHNEGK